ncbi:hypothetical protein C789_108 [Microcystis aeruginosa FACHB-905 = DIANCHI905]|nr:hypothetical protein C789_108 [Microcystis aeruginosa FACHB-905 = DIANCHI905]
MNSIYVLAKLTCSRLHRLFKSFFILYMKEELPFQGKIAQMLKFI